MFILDTQYNFSDMYSTDDGIVFVTGTNPVDADHRIYLKKSHTLKPGITVFTGCNGSGKSVLQSVLQSILHRHKIPYYFYNSLDPEPIGRVSEEKQGIYDFILSRELSEGELSINHFTSSFTDESIDFFCENGIFPTSKHFRTLAFKNLLSPESEEPKKCLGKDRFLFVDSADSGLSVDALLIYKKIFNYFAKKVTDKGYRLFLVITTNDYVLCDGMPCYDVQHNQYITFSSYEDWVAFICRTQTQKLKFIQSAEKRAKSENGGIY